MGFFLLVLNLILVAITLNALRTTEQQPPQRPITGLGPMPKPGELTVISAQPEKIRQLIPEIYDRGGTVREISAKTPQRLVLRFALNLQTGQAAVLLEKSMQETIVFSFDRQALKRVLVDGRSISLSRVRGPTRDKAGILFQRLNALALSAEVERADVA